MGNITPKILCIGSVTQDVYLLAPDIFLPRQVDGERVIQLPLGAKLDLEKVIITSGGNATNAATTFARQGLESIFMGVLGADAMSESILHELDSEGIDTRYVHQDERYKTGYATVILAPNGERTIMRAHGQKLRADGSDINLQALEQADWLYLSSVGSIQLLEKIVSLAAKHNTKIAFNPSTAELQQPEKIRPLLEDVSVLIANKEEMQILVEGTTSEELVRHAVHFVDIVIVSDGPNGAIASDGKQIITAGMYEDVKVVDRLGAGDAFGSGFTAMIAQGKTLNDAVIFASANSTSVVTKIGAKTGILHGSHNLHAMPITITDL
ncbi:MAG: carbohydrate kinase family protein [Candidatus Woesebacteria bacterium]|jgi:ribokinase